MKRFQKGEVWVYRPNQTSKISMDKDRWFSLDIMSERPVIIYRGLDPGSPYNDVVVIPTTTQHVPVVSFPIEIGTNDPMDIKCPTLRAKPYELRTINVRHLNSSRYMGRLSESEIEKLDFAVTRYLEGAAINDVCDAESVKAYINTRQKRETADAVRKAMDMPSLLEDDMYQQLIHIMFNDSTSAETPVDTTPKLPPVNYDGPKFDVPNDMQTLRKVCKTYCGVTRPSAANIGMITSVPLSEAETIIKLSVPEIRERYNVNASSAGALRLLALDYMENGEFSWKISPATDNDGPKVGSKVGSPEPILTDKRFNIDGKPPKITESSLLISKNDGTTSKNKYEDNIKKLRYYLTDKTIRYMPNDLMIEFFKTPKTVLSSAYVGKSFELNYSALKKRAGKLADVKVAE